MSLYFNLPVLELNIPDDIKIRYKLLYGDYLIIKHSNVENFKECLYILFKTGEYTVPRGTISYFFLSDVCMFLESVGMDIEIIRKKNGTIKKIKLV